MKLPRYDYLLVRAYGVCYDCVFGPAWLEDVRLDLAGSGPRLEPAAAETAIAGQGMLPEALSPASGKRDENGFPIKPAGPGVQQGCIQSVCRFRATSASMQDLADRLPCRCTIADETHLPGNYRFVLTADVQRIANPPRPESIEIVEATGARAPAPQDQSFTDIFHALEKQLGLKLERKKVPNPVVYIDHIEKVPAEN